MSASSPAHNLDLDLNFADPEPDLSVSVPASVVWRQPASTAESAASLLARGYALALRASNAPALRKCIRVLAPTFATRTYTHGKYAYALISMRPLPDATSKPSAYFDAPGLKRISARLVLPRARLVAFYLGAKARAEPRAAPRHRRASIDAKAAFIKRTFGPQRGA